MKDVLDHEEEEKPTFQWSTARILLGLIALGLVIRILHLPGGVYVLLISPGLLCGYVLGRVIKVRSTDRVDLWMSVVSVVICLAILNFYSFGLLAVLLTGGASVLMFLIQYLKRG